jgi:hypothetical protein
MAKPSAIYGLIILELIIAILGIASGFSMLSDPSGKGMGLDAIKEKIPFKNLAARAVGTCSASLNTKKGERSLISQDSIRC